MTRRRGLESARNAVLTLARERGPSKSACPSEVARMLAPDDWRAWMAVVRDAVGALYDEGEIAVLQRGKPVSPHTACGPIRIREKRN